MTEKSDSAAGGKTPSIPENDAFSKVDFSFSLWHATLMAAGLTPLIAVVVLGLHYLIWGPYSLLSAALSFTRLQSLLPAVVVSIVAHEGLHWVGYASFGHLPWRSVRFGFSVRSLAAYVHSDSPVTMSAYRRLTVLPGIVLGVIPSCIGIGWNVGWMTLYGFLMLISAGGDFAILWKIRELSPSALVLDHPSRAGCWVLIQESGEVSQSPNATKPIGTR